MVILAQHGLALGGGRQALGAGLAAASALTYAALLLRSKKIIRDISSGALMLGEYGVASIVLLPLVIWSYAHGGGPTSARLVRGARRRSASFTPRSPGSSSSRDSAASAPTTPAS